MKIEIIMFILGAVGALTLGGSLFLKFRRGSFMSHSIEESDTEVTLDEEETNEVIEATFEVLEIEREQDAEFENTVTKIKQEVNDLDDGEFADYINSFFGLPQRDGSENPIVCTGDKSLFDWEHEASKDAGSTSG